MKRIMSIVMLLIAVTFAVPAAMADEGNGNSGNGNSEDDAAEAAEATIAATEGLGATLYDNADNDTEGNETDNETDTEDIEEIETEVEDSQENDEDSQNNDTETEVQDIMSSSHGSQLRLLQLKHQLERRVVFADAAISFLQNKSVNQSVIADLQATRDSLNALIPDVNAALANNSTSVETFLAIKDEAKILVKDFRTKVHTVLKDADIKGLGERFNELDKIKFKEIQGQIKEQRQELNAERVATMLQTMGATVTELAAQVRDGTVTPEQAREQLKEQIQAMNQGKQKEIAEKLREQEAKAKVARADKVLKVKEKELEIRARGLERASKVVCAKNTTSTACARLENRTAFMQDKTEAILQKIQEQNKLRVREGKNGPKMSTPDSGNVDSEDEVTEVTQ